MIVSSAQHQQRRGACEYVTETAKRGSLHLNSLTRWRPQHKVNSSVIYVLVRHSGELKALNLIRHESQVLHSVFCSTSPQPHLRQHTLPLPKVPAKSFCSAPSVVSEQRDDRGRCTSHLLCIPLIIPLMSTTRARLEKTLPNFPNQWKSLKGRRRAQSMPVFT